MAKTKTLKKDERVQGEGEFLTIRNLTDKNLSFHHKVEDEDVAIPVWGSVVVGEHWLKEPTIITAINREMIAAVRTDDIPAEPTFASESDEQLVDAQRELVRLIVIGQYTEQFQGVVRLDKTLRDDGRATSPGVSTTVQYLKEKHVPFLQALQEVEGRHGKRKDVLKDCREALARIRLM